MTEDECFVRITNADIYTEIKLLRLEITGIKTKVKISQWMSGTALSLVVGLIIGMVLK